MGKGKTEKKICFDIIQQHWCRLSCVQALTPQGDLIWKQLLRS